MYCVGRRMKFRSCNSEPCSKQKKDFREEQCASFDGRHFNINGLPPNVRWVPKYSGSKHRLFSMSTHRRTRPPAMVGHGFSFDRVSGGPGTLKQQISSLSVSPPGQF